MLPMKHILSILCIISFSIWMNETAYAQITSRQDKQLLLKADKAYDFGDYLGALKMYETLYAIDSTDNETNFKLGVCNYEIKKLRKNAKKYFDKVPSTDFPEVNYYLAMLNHLARDYEKAIFYFNQYKYFGEDNQFSKKEVDDLIEKCNTAMLFESKQDKAIVIQNMGNTINSEYAEYAPLIPADEKFMLFTSRRKNPIWTNVDPLGDYFEDIYISRKDSIGNWGAPTMLDTVVNTATHDAGTGLSSDGEKLLLYRTSKDLNSGDIYESFYSNNAWSKPETVGSIVNSPEYLETSACISPNGDIIFFSSNRAGGYGGKDLYLVRKLENGKWGKPFNLGPNINTEYDEDAPFVHPLGNTLFFSSEGHKNMGGYDIFKVNFDETGKFEVAQNMGSPINTADDDIFFVMNTDATKAYLSSERDGGFGLQDIYSVTFPSQASIPLNVYNLHVVDESNSVIKEVEIKVIELEKESVYGTYKANDKTGKILIISQPNKEYRVIIDAPGYERLVTLTTLNTNSNILYKLNKKTK
jgi:tetratricopeptide (TPR) repeat protein